MMPCVLLLEKLTMSPPTEPIIHVYHFPPFSFVSSLSKALDRISNTSTSQSSTQPNSPNRTPEKEPTVSLVRQDSSRKMGSPTSPVSPG